MYTSFKITTMHSSAWETEKLDRQHIRTTSVLTAHKPANSTIASSLLCSSTKTNMDSNWQLQLFMPQVICPETTKKGRKTKVGFFISSTSYQHDTKYPVEVCYFEVCLRVKSKLDFIGLWQWHWTEYFVSRWVMRSTEFFQCVLFPLQKDYNGLKMLQAHKIPEELVASTLSLCGLLFFWKWMSSGIDVTCEWWKK